MSRRICLPMEKIKKIEELAEILNSLRGQGKKIVHCHGVFDLLHIGHIRYFEQKPTPMSFRAKLKKRDFFSILTRNPLIFNTQTD